MREGVADAIVGGPEGLRETLGADPAGFLAFVAAARVGADEADRLLRVAVTRRPPGRAQLGGDRPPAGGEPPGGAAGASQRRPTPARRSRGDARAAVVTGVTALGEMGVLEAEGARGRHLVDLRPLYLVLERSPRTWRRRRLTLPSGATQGRRRTGTRPEPRRRG